MKPRSPHSRGTIARHPPERAPARPTITRRTFVSTLAGSVAGAAMLDGARSLAAPAALSPASAGRNGRRKRIAFLATEIRKYSHAQHFIDRFTEGYGWQGRHHYSSLEVAGLYVDQIPEGDLSRDRARRFRLKIYPTIEEALTLGTSKLAVDGVVVIGEHGLYPRNEKGQTLYPRHRFLNQTVKVFEASGRSVPVFNDKHLSTDWNECVEMVQASKRLGFPFLAGSSLPVTWRIPAVEMPWGAPLVESVCVGYGGLDAYDIHGLETAQCMSERRAGGESGVRSVQAVRGSKVWQLLGEREETSRLFFAALSRSFTCRAHERFACAFPDLAWLRQHHKNPVAYFYEHVDGFRTTLFLLNGLIADFNYAGLARGSGAVLSCQMYLPMPPAFTTLADFFNPLAHHIEDMIATGVAPYPVERTLLCSGMTMRAVDSLYAGQALLSTPELAVRYDAPERSCFWRA